jgi:hypothetical protein
MKKVALVALALLALQAVPASAALPADTNPLGTMEALSDIEGADQPTLPAGVRRFVVLLDHSLALGDMVNVDPLSGDSVPLLANGDFAVRFTGGTGGPDTGILPAVIVNHHPRLDDVKSAADKKGASAIPGGGFPAAVSNAVNGVAGFVPDAACTAPGRPQLWAYTITTNGVSSTGAPLTAGNCEEVSNVVSTDGVNFTQTVVRYVPGFWVDFGIAGGGGWSDYTAFLYKAAYDTGNQPDNDFWNTADAAGTGSWSDF